MLSVIISYVKVNMFFGPVFYVRYFKIFISKYFIGFTQILE